VVKYNRKSPSKLKYAMRIILQLIPNLSVLMLLASCAVISPQVRSEAEPPVAFKTLVAEAEKFKGATVILGGYILDITNLESETIIKVLQVPLRIGEEPDLKDSSEGRFLVYHQGFLDPEVYSKDRVITVAGEVIGSGSEEIGGDRIRYLKIKNREIYLWPEYETHPYPYPPWPYPYFWYRHPFYRWPYGYW
jgi:outer membrane lipoprotein